MWGVLFFIKPIGKINKLRDNHLFFHFLWAYWFKERVEKKGNKFTVSLIAILGQNTDLSHKLFILLIDILHHFAQQFMPLLSTAFAFVYFLIIVENFCNWQLAFWCINARCFCIGQERNYWDLIFSACVSQNI